MVKDHIPRRGLPFCRLPPNFQGTVGKAAAAGDAARQKGGSGRQALGVLMAAAKALAVIPPLLATVHVAVPVQNEPVLACIAMGSNFMDPHHPNHPPALLRRPSLLLLLYAHEHRQVKEHHKGVTGPQSALLGRSEMGFPAGVLWKQ